MTQSEIERDIYRAIGPKGINYADLINHPDLKKYRTVDIIRAFGAMSRHGEVTSSIGLPGYTETLVWRV